MGQSVRYEEILPRCEGKLSPLKWKNLTEEDRYTQRAWRIREGSKSYFYKNSTLLLAARPEPIGRSDAFTHGGFQTEQWYALRARFHSND